MNTSLPPGNRERDSRTFSSGVRRRSLACVVLLASVVGVVTLFVQVTDPWIGLRLAARARVVALGAEWLGSEGVVLQQGLHDCGPAALANLIRLHGRTPPSLAKLTRSLGTTPEGTRASDLMRVAREHGLQLQTRQSTLAAVRRDEMPIIAWVESRHFVVVAPHGSDRRLQVIDPRMGAYAVERTQLAREWSGVVLSSASTRPSVLAQRSTP